jgi:hypothetical protein
VKKEELLLGIFSLVFIIAFYPSSNVFGSWSIDLIDSGGKVGEYSSLALDHNDIPHISYNRIDGSLNYATYNKDKWMIIAVNSPGDIAQDNSIALGNRGWPAISYYEQGNGDLKYSYYTENGWETLTIDSSGDVGQYNSLSFDSQNRPHISYL